uniref:pectin lyase n=1 Tax=Cuerna arida TaxID=1464854 RepID=A0A1B6FDN0_9HEMI
MEKLTLLFTTMFAFILSGEAFFKPRHHKHLPTYVPKTLDEVKNYLCESFEGGECVDTKPAKIIINKVFDFTGSEGMKEELGCYHCTMPAKCLTSGQLKLNVNNQCNGLVPTTVRYSQAGRCGIDVGSNKIIVGENGGGLKGKGLRLRNSHDVEIRNLNITDINPQVIWGGDAIDLINVENVLLDGNYIKNIGRQMVVTHFGNNTGVLMTNNVFDGNTPYSAYCDGAHYWLWLFLGEYDRIAIRNNVIFNTSGRGPHVVASKNSTILVHMLQNVFYDVKDAGLIELGDTRSSILVEGNVFVNVKEVVHINTGNIYMPQNKTDQLQCKNYLGRQCLLNIVVNSGGAKPVNSLTVLQDFKGYKDVLAKPIM